MIIALILLTFVINNAIWMFFLWMFIPERKVKAVKLPKLKIPGITTELPKRKDDLVPLTDLDSVDSKAIMDSMRKK